MAPFNTLFNILILAIPLAVAIPRYTTETFSLKGTSLEASAYSAHCGSGVWPHTCWRYCGETGQWCWIQASTYCDRDGDCDSNAPCSGGCGRSNDPPKDPDFEAFKFKSDARPARPVNVAIQVTLEVSAPAANAVEAVTLSGPGHSSSVPADAHSSLEASAYSAHCGSGVWPHTCWRYCGETGQWCWIQASTYCDRDGDCSASAPCSGGCGRSNDPPKDPDFQVANPRVLLKLLIG